MNTRRPLLWLILFAGISHMAGGQIILTGMVVDSASMEALPNVNILNKQTGKRTVSDIRGGFALDAGAQDTILFSRIGYLTRVLSAARAGEMVIIFLREERRMLDPVEIRERNLPAWLPTIPRESSWKNTLYDTRGADIPGFRGIQTFGPGYVFRMPGSGFKKEAREKQKLQEVRKENEKARDYIHLVNSAEIKGKIMRDFRLSEAEYYRLLAIFNEKNRDFLYRLEPHEVVPLLLQFYAEHRTDK